MEQVLAPAPSLWRPPAPYPRMERPGVMEALRILRSDLLAIWQETSFREPVGEWHFLGNHQVLVNDPALVRHVLVDNEPNYRKSLLAVRLLEPVVGNGLLLSEEKVWQRQRRILAPAFTPRAVHALAPSFAEATADMLDGWEGLERLDLLKASEQLTLDIAARTMFSTRLGPRVGAFAAMVEEYQHRIGNPRMLDYLAQAGLRRVPNWPRLEFRKRWRSVIGGFLDERMQRPTPAGAPADVLDLLLKARDPETGEGFSREEIIDQVGTMMAAGFETTAMALFWTFHLLGAMPAIQEDLRDEVRGADLSPGAAAQSVQGMPKLQAMIQESMRLYPPAHTISRVAVGPDRIAGIPVAPGSTIIISPWVLHRHRKLWRDPDRFDLTRFLPGSPEAGRPFTWMPFGGGPRICIGMAFARIEMAVVVAQVLSRFRLTVADPDAVCPVGRVTTVPQGDTTISVTRIGTGHP